jgi:16S rRNA (adenine1518-N6/adenine1519-N6)-dimethyltransferase
VKKLLKIDKTSFFPVPDVDSAFMELDFAGKEPVKVKDEKFFFRVVHAGFAQRRKMLINNIKRELEAGNRESGAGNSSKKTEIEDAFKSVGIDLKARAEAVSILDFAKLSDMLYNKFNS